MACYALQYLEKCHELKPFPANAQKAFFFLVRSVELLAAECFLAVLEWTPRSTYATDQTRVNNDHDWVVAIFDLIQRRCCGLIDVLEPEEKSDPFSHLSAFDVHFSMLSDNSTYFNPWKHRNQQADIEPSMDIPHRLNAFRRAWRSMFCFRFEKIILRNPDILFVHSAIIQGTISLLREQFDISVLIQRGEQDIDPWIRIFEIFASVVWLGQCFLSICIFA